MTDEQKLKAAWLQADAAAVEAMERYTELRDLEQVAWKNWRSVLLDLRKQDHAE